MAADQQTYNRAANGAAIGGVVQLLMAAAFLLVGVASGFPAAQAVAWYAAGGVPIWAILWLLFQQHRLSLLEALETERLAQGTPDSSLFEASADLQHMARARLRQLYRWGLPVTSLLVVGYLLAAAAVQLLYTGNKAWFYGEGGLSAYPVPDGVPALMAFSAALTFVSFVASRFLSGLSRLEGAVLLRGGAAYLTGQAALGLLLTGTLGLANFGNALGLRLLTCGAPLVLLLLAVEIALNFLLQLYRPRRAGETPRPAFDSRLLALLSEPGGIAKTINEAINYQVGFEITRSWFWRLLERSFTPLVAFALLVMMLQTTIVIVEPHQQALVVHLGKLPDAPRGPGISFKAPWPLATVEYHDVERLREVVIGSHGTPGEAHDHGAHAGHDHGAHAGHNHGGHDHGGHAGHDHGDHAGHDHGEAAPTTEETEGDGQHGMAILWTNDHGHEEKLLIVAPAASSPTGESDDQRVPSVSLIGGEIAIHYRITDLLAFVRNHADPERAFWQLAEAEVARYLLRHPIDTWLRGDERERAADAIKRQLQAVADRAQLGLGVVWVGMPSIHPPQQVAVAFHEVIGAQQERHTEVEAAKQEATRQLAEVAGSVERARVLVERIGSLERLSSELNETPDDEREPLRARIAKGELAVDALLARAGGKAARVVSEARAYRWQRENGERARAERFIKELMAFRASPRVYRSRRYLEVLSEGMADSRKILLITKDPELVVRFDLKDDADAAALAEAVAGAKADESE